MDRGNTKKSMEMQGDLNDDLMKVIAKLKTVCFDKF